MKKQLLLLSALVLTTLGTINAQQKITIAKEQFFKKAPKQTLVGKVAGVTQIDAYFYTTGYEAGMNNYVLNMTLGLVNTDLEYVDSVTIVFPTGITPVSSPNTTFPSAITTASLLEQYNGVSGQQISWGNNDDSFGGVAGAPLNFQVLVNVTPGLTGVQTGTIYLSGDGYVDEPFTQTPGDAAYLFSINQKTANDLSIENIILPTSSCLNDNEQIAVWYKNNGTTAASTFTLSYTVNGGTPVLETYTGAPIAIGDTLKYTFNTLANLTAPMVYSISCNATILGDLTSDNSFTLTTETYPKNNAPYETSFESTPASQLQGWTSQNVSGLSGWSTYSSAHTGTLSLNAYNSANGVSENWLYSPCLNLQSGKTYYARFWSKLATNYSGSLSVVTGTTNTTAMSQVIKPLTALTANNTWVKDSIAFTVPTTDVYYIAFIAKNTNAADNIDLYVDDFKIDETAIPTSINSIVTDEVSVYPNPTTGILNVYSPNGYLTVEVYNAIGQNVFTTQTTVMGNNQLDVSTLPIGTYTVKLSNDRNLTYKRIVIQK